MKHKTWFRLVLKAAGVILFFQAMPMFIGWAVVFLFSSIYRSAKLNDVLYSLLPYALMALSGIYLFFGGKWIADYAIPGNRNYCRECGYDVTHSPSEVCSECGTRLPAISAPGKDE